MFNEQLSKIKDAVSDPAFQKKVIQQVVKMVVVTTAVAVTSYVLRQAESGISAAFENYKDDVIDIATPSIEE